MTPADTAIAQSLISRLERLATRSPAVMREAVYEELAAQGVDVPALAGDARALMRAEAESKMSRWEQIAKLIANRLRSGQLPPGKAAEAKRQLALAPMTIKAQKAVLKRIEARPAPPQPSAPTRELVRHYGHEPSVRDREPDGTILSAPRYEFQWALDRCNVEMTAEEYGAALRFREAFLRRQNTPGAVDWNRSGGSVPGSRLPIRDEQLRASQDYNAVWYRLPPAVRVIASNFLLEVAPRGMERPLDAVEFGKMYGATKDPNRARGVTCGAVRTACSMIAGLQREYDEWKHQKRQRETGGDRGLAQRLIKAEAKPR
jgi:hypothetical protein